MRLLNIEECSAEERKIVLDGLYNYNMEQVPATNPENWIPFEYVVRNEDQEIIAGILSTLGYWNGLEIKILWVNEDYRKSGIGTKLLTETENNAKAKGAIISFLDTFDFQAKDFYLKNGYSIFGILDDFPAGHKRYYLQKRL
jgi:GNAT superfamily N-acetyltransferase